QTSRSVVHAFSIPKSARLESVTVDGRPQAVKSEDGKVRVSLAPGTALIVAEWHAPEGLKALFSSPQVHTGAPGVNFRTVIDLPSERWLLLVGGPPRGPALLFWGYLLLIVGAAILLPRIAFSHLKTRDWLLLGLGLTQVPAAVAVRSEERRVGKESR